MSVRAPGMREPRGGHDMMIQPRGRGLCSLLNRVCISRTGREWHKVIFCCSGTRLNWLSIGDSGIWRNCRADRGGSAN